VLLEVLRSSDERSRIARVEAMLACNGQRLPSEAELSINDFINAVRRYRPQWFRPRVDMSSANHYRALWTEEVWELARSDSATLHEWQNSLDPWAEALSIQIQKRNRRLLPKDYVPPPYSECKVQTAPYQRRWFGGTWDGTSTARWRVENGQRYWDDFRGQPGSNSDTMRDFLGAYLDFDAVLADADDFRRLWFDSITERDVRRDWLRGAVNYYQIPAKIQDSNARDEQHSAYLVDADLFLSADRRLIDLLGKIRDEAAFGFAEPRLVALGANNDWFVSILEAGESAR